MARFLQIALLAVLALASVSAQDAYQQGLSLHQQQIAEHTRQEQQQQATTSQFQSGYATGISAHQQQLLDHARQEQQHQQQYGNAIPNNYNNARQYQAPAPQQQYQPQQQQYQPQQQQYQPAPQPQEEDGQYYPHLYENENNNNAAPAQFNRNPSSNDYQQGLSDHQRQIQEHERQEQQHQQLTQAAGNGYPQQPQAYQHPNALPQGNNRGGFFNNPFGNGK